MSDGLLEIAERAVVGGGFKLTEAAQREGGDGGGGKLEEMGKGVDCAGILVGAVLQDAKVPPAFLPIRLDLLGLGVELDGEGQVLLVARGGGTGCEVFERSGGLPGGRRLLREGDRMRGAERGNQDGKQKAASGRSGEEGNRHVLPGMPCKVCDLGRIRNKNIAGKSLRIRIRRETFVPQGTW